MNTAKPALCLPRARDPRAQRIPRPKLPVKSGKTAKSTAADLQSPLTKPSLGPGVETLEAIDGDFAQTLLDYARARRALVAAKDQGAAFSSALEKVIRLRRRVAAAGARFGLKFASALADELAEEGARRAAGGGR